MMKFTIITLGCKVNQFESESIGQYLKESGWISAEKDERADVCIINTCAVTGKASMQSRQAVRKIIRKNPDSRIIVTGCSAQTEADEFKQINGVHEIIGHADKLKIPEFILNTALNGNSPSLRLSGISGIKESTIFSHIPVTVSDSRTRPFLKIQDGCNAFCTYCIVPYARGKSRSMKQKDVIENIRKLKNAGKKEIVLSGIHLGKYGLDLKPATCLFELIKMIENSCEIDRLRLSSIEPHELTQELIKFVSKSPGICNHFHIPLQSGDDQILKRMNRPYSAAFFEELVINIKKQMPDAAIGADVLIGFPGETENAFENTRSLIEELPVSYLHVFPFSPRKGTAASTFADQIRPETIKKRAMIMRRLGKNKKNKFYREALGTSTHILVEEKRDRNSGLLKGVTSNYLTVLIDGKDELKNSIVFVKIKKFYKDVALYGMI